MEAIYAPGLENVIAAETALSDVDGARGHLVIAGHDVEELAPHASFEEAAALLWTTGGMNVHSRVPGVRNRDADGPTAGDPTPGSTGRAPAGAGPTTGMNVHSADDGSVRDPDMLRGALDAVGAALGAARVAAFAALPRLGDALAAADGMDALRGAVAQLVPTPRRDAAGLAESLAADAADAVAASGAIAVYAAAWARGRRGLAPVAPDPDAGHAADYLRMIDGEPAAPARARALDRYLVTVSDHGMNASTFAARVVASTGSDAVSAVVAAIGALKGPLHGGAPGPVLDMLDAIGEPDRAAAWLEAELAAGRRIMGMGHRVYRVRDPRAAVLERALGDLEREVGAAGGRLALARAVERAATGLLAARHPDRALAANVEFYTAVLLDAIGLPRTMFTPTFAVARVLGWTAHVAEQRRTGRLIRPKARYRGPAA